MEELQIPKGYCAPLPKATKKLARKTEFQTLLINPQLQIIKFTPNNIKNGPNELRLTKYSKLCCPCIFYSMHFCTSAVISDKASTLSSKSLINTLI